MSTWNFLKHTTESEDDNIKGTILKKYIGTEIPEGTNSLVDNYEIEWLIENLDFIKRGSRIISPSFITKIANGTQLQTIQWNFQTYFHYHDHVELTLMCEFYPKDVPLPLHEIQIKANVLFTCGKFNNKKTIEGQRYVHNSANVINFFEFQKKNATEPFKITCSLLICEKIFWITNIYSQPNDKIRALFNEEKFSDVCISVRNNQHFFAHKIILSMHSEVFAAMFDHQEVVENLMNEVKIVDFDYITIENMLKFMYYKKPVQISIKLLAAANKYDVKLLKTLCERTIGLSLTTDNAIDALIAADQHEAVELKTFALNFLICNFADCEESLKAQINRLRKTVLVELCELQQDILMQLLNRCAARNKNI